MRPAKCKRWCRTTEEHRAWRWARRGWAIRARAGESWARGRRAHGQHREQHETSPKGCGGDQGATGRRRATGRAPDPNTAFALRTRPRGRVAATPAGPTGAARPARRDGPDAWERALLCCRCALGGRSPKGVPRYQKRQGKICRMLERLCLASLTATGSSLRTPETSAVTTQALSTSNIDRRVVIPSGITIYVQSETSLLLQTRG